ncbi:Fe-S cluster assembly protein IscX [Pseudomonas sp. HMWF021]|uniref:Fe-S cluster assembly protein IscX n=1 Tax=Pseudomonas sp. HMWF021 TaxID=2056857 RepID=UPI000D390302|nr:Fe-S cluster assembly protein IscX [Pseudomonas sp. HMWF021]PTT30070.1 Fe-S assembly protein IscX [Pseudomonas sp. HMWF021]
MSYGWNDVQRIAEELAEAHEGLDPYSVGFVRLQHMIEELPDFDKSSGRVGEKVLERVQELWAAELD